MNGSLVILLLFLLYTIQKKKKMSTIQFPPPAPHTFGKGSRRHLDPTLVAGVDLEIVPVGRVETQQAQPLQANILFIRSLVLFPSSPTPLNPQRVPSCVTVTYIERF